MRNGYRTEVIIPINSIIPFMKRVVHTAPRVLYYEILKEMEEMKLVKLIGNNKILILNNKDCEKTLKRLKEYVFPINP